jgi:hypothetical protein
MKSISKQPVPFLVLVILVFGLQTFGQQKAEMQIASDKIKQGSQVTFQVTLDRASNVDGGVFITIVPEGGVSGYSLEFNRGMSAKEAKTTISAQLPFDAKIGEWTVTQVSFHPSGGLPIQQLTKSGELSFEVIEHGPLAFPTGASIQIR